MTTHFFPYKKQNGVLKYFYTHYQSQYYTLINVSASSYNSGRLPEHAIDWISSSYWHGDTSKTEKKLKICFTKNRFLPIGYEIQVSDKDCRPIQFSMTGSNIYNVWENTVKTAKTLTPGEIFYQNWNNTNVFRCFQFEHYGDSTCTSTNHHNSADIAQIEFFGTLFPLNFKTCKCFHINLRFVFNLLIVYIL